MIRYQEWMLEQKEFQAPHNTGDPLYKYLISKRSIPDLDMQILGS